MTRAISSHHPPPLAVSVSSIITNLYSWWGSRIFARTTQINRNKAGATTRIMTASMASQYCQFPSRASPSSPTARGPRGGGFDHSKDRKRGARYYSCDNFAGCSGPAMLRKRRGRRRGLNEVSPAEVRRTHTSGAMAPSTTTCSYGDGTSCFDVDDSGQDDPDPDEPEPEDPEEPEQPDPPTCDDRCKLDRGSPCNCGENGCNDNSPG
ncbi:hypothetical protein PG994_002836 [Apiospora phragmitis]|uniref:Uncharacterized protein n=1 Tax=Apiospora phragmitis TaxID=2905665 RepID=A0ABR1W6B1_9PEZI